ncbi:hypothetical protein LX36DRAFT_721161 [Colletotrichum falcatum]|nr:hypothetical protein LX36DRAFT_721161 [Colletotrichum falcatum]
MAEVFGVVVSALTVAGMASTFSASILKLNRFWGEVQDAPGEISQHIRQLAIVKPMLEEMEAGLRDEGRQRRVRDSSVAGLSMGYCRQAVDELELLAEDLQGRIGRARRSRGLVRLKVTLKKDVLQRYHERIQFALQLLALSQQTYIIQREAGSVQITAEDDRSERTRSASRVDESVETLPIDSRRPKSSSLVWLEPSVFGGFTYATSAHEKKPSTQVYEARLQLPWWLSNKVWDLQAQTSLRDRNPQGWTLLHKAAFGGNVDVFVNLIKLGLSTQDKTEIGFPVLLLLWLMKNSAEEVVNVMEILALSGSLDEYLASLFHKPLASKTFSVEAEPEVAVGRRISVLVWNFPGVLEFMAAELQVDPLQLPPDARFASLDWRYADPDLLLDEIGRGNNNLDTFAEAYFFGVQGLTYRAHHASERDFGTEAKIESWRKLARRVLPAASLEALTQTVPVSVVRGHNLSPLFSGLFHLTFHFGYFDMKKREWQRRISRAVVMWLEDAQSSGIDLDEYGIAVRKLYLDKARLHGARWYLKGGMGPRLVALTVGPMPEDWKLHWDWDFDEYEFAGEFWERVENPPLRIPGGWIGEWDDE